MTLLLGDLNTCDYELGYRLLRQHTELLDAFREKEVSGVSVCLIAKQQFFKK
jgi:hypothetical protein